MNAGLESLARESAQNSNDARLEGEDAEMVFSVIRLTGAEREAFEDALGWSSELAPHLRSMANGNQVISNTIREGLTSYDDSQELVLLRIEDRGCRGLTGPEWTSDDVPEDDFGNFIKLCRLDLFSGKNQAAGGSFGLGKAVYWRFSRFQTVAFNSTLRSDDAVDGEHRNRLFGVNQGTMHTHDEGRYQSRGHFGLETDDGRISSAWDREDLIEQLLLARPDERPGTSALIIGFFDPDNPGASVTELRDGLESGIEENFWPLIARGGMRFHVEVVEEGDVTSVEVDSTRNFPELTHALRRFDEGALDDRLDDVGDVVACPIKIDVPRRKSAPHHDEFVHEAHLVVTLSDDNADSLENKVCLFRKPEMVVQALSEEFPTITYHAFLVAGAAVRPEANDQALQHADDFLRFAEPPAHDLWIPSGRSPQTSLGSHYVAPYLPQLRGIGGDIRKTLRELFGVIPPESDRGPESILRHLRLLDHGPGSRDGRRSKPTATLLDWGVNDDDQWEVSVEIEARRRDEGWSFEPALTFLAVEGGGQRVKWTSLVPEADCEVVDGRVVLASKSKGRSQRARFRGVTDASSHPIPARSSAIDVELRRPAPANDSGAGS